MTDGSTATIDIKDLFSKEDITLENYTRFREAALANENSTRALEELADKLDTSNAKSAVKKGIALWLLGKTKPAIEALTKGHEKADETASAFLGRLLLATEDAKTAKAKLKEADVRYEGHRYLARHAFANETAQGTGRIAKTQYDAAWAQAAWDRTMRFFGQHLG